MWLNEIQAKLKSKNCWPAVLQTKPIGEHPLLAPGAFTSSTLQIVADLSDVHFGKSFCSHPSLPLQGMEWEVFH